MSARLDSDRFDFPTSNCVANTVIETKENFLMQESTASIEAKIFKQRRRVAPYEYIGKG